MSARLLARHGCLCCRERTFSCAEALSTTAVRPAEWATCLAGRVAGPVHGGRERPWAVLVRDNTQSARSHTRAALAALHCDSPWRSNADVLNTCRGWALRSARRTPSHSLAECSHGRESPHGMGRGQQHGERLQVAELTRGAASRRCENVPATKTRVVPLACLLLIRAACIACSHACACTCGELPRCETSAGGACQPQPVPPGRPAPRLRQPSRWL